MARNKIGFRFCEVRSYNSYPVIRDWAYVCVKLIIHYDKICFPTCKNQFLQNVSAEKNLKTFFRAFKTPKKISGHLVRPVTVAKAFLKLPNLHMLVKQKSLLVQRNLAPWIFGELLMVFSTKVNLLYLHTY